MRYEEQIAEALRTVADDVRVWSTPEEPGRIVGKLGDESFSVEIYGRQAMPIFDAWSTAGIHECVEFTEPEAAVETMRAHANDLRRAGLELAHRMQGILDYLDDCTPSDTSVADEDGG